MHIRIPFVRVLLCATVVRSPLAILALVSVVTGCAALLAIDGQHSITYEDGDRFDGLWRGGVPQSGTVTYANGNIYTGEVSGGSTKHGKGAMAYKNGCRHEGDWRDGRRHGAGAYNCPNGYTESGNYEYGNLHGFAKVSFPGGAVYEGQFKEGVKEDPQGTWRWPDIGEYKGTIVLDMRNGAGLYTRASDGLQSLHFYRNEHLLVAIPIVADGAEIACDAVPRGWRLASGACNSGRLDGVVELVSDDGWRRFKATYGGGAPQGRAVQDWIFNDANGAWQIVGTARGPDNFTSGNLIQSGYFQGTDTYDPKQHAWRHIYAGAFKGAYPTIGRCIYEDWEPCEYRGTERVDAVHLKRMAEAERERIAYKRQEQEYAAAVRREEEERRSERAAEKREREDADREALQGYLNGLSAQTEQLESQRLANNARTPQLIARAQAEQADGSASRSATRNRADPAEASQERRRSNDVPSATLDDEPVLTAENKPQRAQATAAAVTKIADANPYEKYPAYDAPWGNPVAPWGGAASGLGSTRAEACSAARTKGLPEYSQRVARESRGTRRVTQSSECVCRNYAYGFGWIENVTCQIYVQIEVVKKGEGGTVDR